ncbi:MAG: hypothetical protein ACRDO0_20365, partial [Nocardioidaceae bacterium]
VQVLAGMLIAVVGTLVVVEMQAAGLGVSRGPRPSRASSGGVHREAEERGDAEHRRATTTLRGARQAARSRTAGSREMP